jgi:multiple sugar transport system ATP-binding protein
LAGITLTNVTKRFPGFKAVDDLNLTIEDGEFLVLVGPSGCGKTTVLRMIAGLETLTEGQTRIGEVDVTALPPKDRDVAMVFQDYALYPHLSVEKNLGIGLKLRGVPKQERRVRVLKVAELLGLEELLARRPAQLSGGQRQRVAIGRAMVREPRVYLMDEPLSNLDAKLRVQMRAELGRLRDRLRVTTVYVTHDQVEAMTLGDRVAVLNGGVLQQVDTAQELFNHPVNTFVAGFIGSPEMNLVHATVVDGGVRFANHVLALPPDSGIAPGAVVVGIRPTDFERVAPGGRPGSTMTVRADVLESLGAEVRLVFLVDAPSGAEAGSATTGPAAEDLALLRDPSEGPRGGTTFTASLKEDGRLQPGTDVTLAVDPAALHFFDPQTGVAIGTRARRNPTTDVHER